MRYLYLSFCLISFSTQAVFAQTSGDAKAYSGAISVTTKGISTVPSFTLGKPALTFDTSIGAGSITFEPQLRFALEGKPWSFLFWWRYRTALSDRVNLRIGAHPGFSFITTSVIRDGLPEDIIEARRFLAGELYPSYKISSHLNVGIYYLYSHGVEKSTLRNLHFISFVPAFGNIKLSPELTLSFSPQIYYLKIDDIDGFYLTSSLTISKKDFPYSFSARANKILDTDIAGDDFLWNVSVAYAF